MNNRTSSERIMDALDLLDEDMALEVAKLREKKKKIHLQNKLTIIIQVI